MTKQEFLARLREGLRGLPEADIEERLTFYGEMLDDRMEEGLSEEEAVAAVGSVDEIVAQVVAETPLTKIAKERIRPKRRLGAGEIVLLVLGSPIWLSLGIAAAAVLVALYAVVWSVIVSLWAVFASLAVCAVGSIPLGVWVIANGRAAAGIATLAAGLVCAGLAILMFFGCLAATKGVIVGTGRSVLWVKDRLIGKKEDV